MVNRFAFAPRAAIVALQHLQRWAEPFVVLLAPLAGFSGIPKEWGAAGLLLITSVQFPIVSYWCKALGLFLSLPSTRPWQGQS